MNKQKGFTIVELLVVVIILGGIVGWVLNIVAVAHANFSAIGGMLILRVVGIFIAPLGAVLGFI